MSTSFEFTKKRVPVVQPTMLPAVATTFNVRFANYDLPLSTGESPNCKSQITIHRVLFRRTIVATAPVL